MGKVKEALMDQEAGNNFVSDQIYKPEEDKLVCTGILKAFRFGTNKFDTKTEKYFVSILTSLDAETRKDIKDRYFSEAKEKYIPEPFREIKNGECYFNLKSLYEIPVFKLGEGNKKYSFDEVIEMGDGLPPYGSTVKLSMRLKEGAIYPLALQIIEIRKANADDYFD